MSVEIKRMLAPLKRAIYLIIGRAILTVVNNAESTQKVQITGLADETITDVERFQEYGFETYPETGAEALAVFINGNREQGIVVTIHDRRYRPKTLAEGETMQYTKWHTDSVPHNFYLKEGKTASVGGTKVEMGDGTVELLDLFDQLIDALKIATVMTSLGPQLLDAATQTTLGLIQTDLGIIKV